MSAAAPAAQKRLKTQFKTLADEREAAHQFVGILEQMVPPEARLIMCQFSGDPDTVTDATKWKPKVWKSALVQEGWNVYLCISAMGRGGIGDKFRRTKECWEGGLAIMVDDLGTKLPLELIDKLEPTALIETSPSNYQAIYVFSALVDRLAEQEALINNFVERYAKEEGKRDPGMTGINRVFRPPFGINGKAKYRDEKNKPWRVKLTRFNPAARYTPQEIADAFGITLDAPLRNFRSTRKLGDRDARIADFERLVTHLLRSGVLKNRQRPFNRAGWAEVHCPWRDNHTNGADNGASIRWPAEDNDYNGAFKCHHGHCEDKTWSDFTQMVTDQIGDELDTANSSAPNSIEGMLK